MSGRKNNLATFVSLAAGDMSADVTSAATDIRWLDNVVMYLTFTGTPTGTFKVQVSPDNLTWVDLALVPTPTASGAGGSHRIGLNQLPDPYVRAAYTAASGSGSLTVKIAGKMI
jgi:hypothetical protein